MKRSVFFSPGLVLLSILSAQIGAALAKNLFPALGPLGTVSVRVFWAALILLALWRPRLAGRYNRAAYWQVGLFGGGLAAMNLTFYLALSKLPLGVAATVEFVGPLTLAIVQSRRMLDLLWVAFAACGLFLLTPLQGLGANGLSLVGIGLALLAGTFWACYILLNARVGKIFPGSVGLALATGLGALLLLPVGLPQAWPGLLAQPGLLVVGAGVGLLSSALPYSLEMEALRHLSSRVFSILLSLEPAVAALAGFLVLHETLNGPALVAIFLICAASVGVVFSRKEVV